jgi:S-adenosylmethionine hydrolase
MKSIRKMFTSLRGKAAVLVVAASAAGLAHARSPLVLMSDFGLADGAVAAMHGVALGVDPQLSVSDLTHEIPDFDIWAGAYRLYQTADYWPQGTVFVSVVDPGVGTQRKSIVLKTANGRFFVGPDNGLFTLIAERDGVAEVREIDERVNRLPGSAESYTFHGRDVYAYTGARLSSGQIGFEQVGPRLDNASITLLRHPAARIEDGRIKGGIPVLDVKYGNVWTDIPKPLFEKLAIRPHDRVTVRLRKAGSLVAEVTAPFESSFGQVPKGGELVYVNSLLNVALAVNQGNFAKVHGIESGPDWEVEIAKAP